MNDTRIIRWALALALFAALAGRVAFFTISVRHVPPSADECLSPLQAERILAGHFPLLVMANPYQFPVEAYLDVPVVRWLPRNAFGARLIPFLEGLAALGAFLWLARRASGPGRRWPAVLLILLPSAYLLLLVSAYAIPQHGSFMLLFALTLLATFKARDGARGARGIAAAAGLLAGLTVSNHLLALPLLAMTAAYIGFGEERRKGLVLLACFGLGAAVGLAPYIAAKVLIPGAYESVTRPVPWNAAAARIWSPLFVRTLPAAFGINPCVFPDTRSALGFLAGWEKGFSVFFLLILGAATIVSIGRFFRRSVVHRWPVVSAGDVFVGIAWISMALFILNARSLSHTFRYLLPAVLVFPFLVAGLFDNAPRAIRLVLGVCVAGLAAVNVASSVLLMRQWAQPGFAEREANIFDLKPALERLDAMGIRSCYASYWVAYRVNFESGGRILCSQPYNERFFGFPVPYKDEVDAATNVAFVLAPKTAMTPERFERDLAAMEVSSAVATCGVFTVYSDFAARRADEGRRIAAWDAPRVPPPASVEFQLPARSEVTKLVLKYDGATGERFSDVSLRGDDGCRVVKTGKPEFDAFVYENGHPVYGACVQTVRPNAGKVDGGRIAVGGAPGDFPWTIGRVDVYARE